MDDVLVFGSAFTDKPSDWACFRESAEKLGINFLVVGSGRPRPGDVQLFIEAAALLRERTEPYVLFSDTFDAFFARWDGAEVAKRIEEAPGHLIVAAEDWVWPPIPPCEAVYKYHQESFWFAANGGGSCGTRGAAIALLDTCAKRLYEVGYGANQELLHKLLSEGYPMQLDTNCSIFQTFHGTHAQLITYDDAAGMAMNATTGSFPMILHFNGTCPGMRQWYEKIWGNWPRTPGLKPD